MTPVLRKDYAVLPNGRAAIALGDAHSVHLLQLLGAMSQNPTVADEFTDIRHQPTAGASRSR